MKPSTSTGGFGSQRREKGGLWKKRRGDFNRQGNLGGVVNSGKEEHDQMGEGL